MEIKVFLCAHKPIENYIPENYTILDVNGTVNLPNHTVIDISKDKFTRTHNVCYSEGCAMRWLWKHPEVIPEYICFGHYRRMFIEFVGNENKMIDIINKHGAIIKLPFNHGYNDRHNNCGTMFLDHPGEESEMFIKSVKESSPEYWNTFQKLLESRFQFGCNCFAMKKEHFLEMCEMCFKVLDLFDKRQNYNNNEDVYNKMLQYGYDDSPERYYNISWQARLQGFYLEWLTELYYRQKFGIKNCYKTTARILKR